MKKYFVRPFLVLFGFVLCAGIAAAQDAEQHGSKALRIYYNDLNQTLSRFELSDVPFQPEQVLVGNDDSLLELARQHRFRALDFYHLAAALYEINSQAIENDDGSRLVIGATINLPTVEELFAAQDRYEKLKFVGEELDFNNQENQMRKALRWPFGKSLVMIGPYAKDELPGNQEVTLTSYRPDSLSIKGNTGADFLSSASSASASQQTDENTIILNGEKETVSWWLAVPEKTSTAEDAQLTGTVDQEAVVQTEPLETTGSGFAQSKEAIQIVESLPLEDTGAQETVSLSGGLRTYSSWLDQSKEVTRIADTLPVQEVEKVEIASSLQPATEIDLAAVEVPDSASAIDAKPVLQTEPASGTITLLQEKAEAEAEIKTEPLPVVSSGPAGETIAKVEPVISVPVVNENDLTEQPVSLPAENIEPLNKNIMTVVAAAKPALTRDTNLVSLAPKDSFYLGPPRSAVASTSNDVPSDPLDYLVEWSFDGSVSVGTALNKLADYIGYELLSDDDLVLSTYNRQLPGMQLRVGGVTAEEGFAILAGRGLETVFDHVARSVKHVPKTDRPSKRLTDAVKNTGTHAKFMQQMGITAMLRQFPNDIQNAAKRHAMRCDSSANTGTPDVERLNGQIVDNLRQKTQEAVALNLVEWYDSPTGRKVRQLERGDIDDKKLSDFTGNKGRATRIQQIYNNTVTGKGIASIAVELDYAGWVLSGCTQAAERSGDAQKVSNEQIYGQRIKNKFVKLESILRGDMLRSMDYLFSSLNDAELTEYSDITMKHAGTHSELQQSIMQAIEAETKELL